MSLSLSTRTRTDGMSHQNSEIQLIYLQFEYNFHKFNNNIII